MPRQVCGPIEAKGPTALERQRQGQGEDPIRPPVPVDVTSCHFPLDEGSTKHAATAGDGAKGKGFIPSNFVESLAK